MIYAACPLPDDTPREHFSTGFEDWCELMGLHPDDIGAWETFEVTTRPVAGASGLLT